MCLSTAADLIEANQIAERVGAEVVYQKVAGVGRARKSGVEFKQSVLIEPF